MKTQKTILALVLCASLFSGMMACGDGEVSGGGAPIDPSLGGGGVLTLSPAGPANLKKGQSLDFDTNLSGSTFSVEGGDSNGTINADGVYSPPAKLPLNPQITVKATQGSQTVSALVNLSTGDTASFDDASKKQITDSPLASATTFADFQLNAERHRLAVSSVGANLQVASLWTSFDGVNSNGAFDVSTNLGSFGTDKNPVASTNKPFSGSIAYAPDGTLHIILMEKSGLKYALNHYSTSNGGATYASHAIFADAANNLFMPSLSIDKSGGLHLVFTKTSGSPLGAPQTLYYTKSSNGGATWSTPVEINAASANPKFQPNLSVSADGTTVDLCWIEASGAQTDIYFGRSINGGASFQPAIPLTSSAALKEGQCQIAKNGSDTYVLYAGIHVLFVFENMEIFVTKTSDGTSFNAPVQVNSDTAHLQAFPFMSVDPLGRIDVIWASDRDGDASNIPDAIFYARSIDGGNTFSTNVAVESDPAFKPVIPLGLAHDDAGRLHMSFIELIGTDLHIFYKMAE